jgi:hypothetical protein
MKPMRIYSKFTKYQLDIRHVQCRMKNHMSNIALNKEKFNREFDKEMMKLIQFQDFLATEGSKDSKIIDVSKYIGCFDRNYKQHMFHLWYNIKMVAWMQQNYTNKILIKKEIRRQSVYIEKSKLAALQANHAADHPELADSESSPVNPCNTPIDLTAMRRKTQEDFGDYLFEQKFIETHKPPTQSNSLFSRPPTAESTQSIFHLNDIMQFKNTLKIFKNHKYISILELTIKRWSDQKYTRIFEMIHNIERKNWDPKSIGFMLLEYHSQLKKATTNLAPPQ